MRTLSPSDRFDLLLDVTLAWHEDERRKPPHASSWKPSALAPLLRTQWKELFAELEVEGTKPEKEERQRLGAIFDRRLSLESPIPGDRLRNGLSALEKTEATSEKTTWLERMKLALLKAGCWTYRPQAGQTLADLERLGPYAEQLNRANAAGQVDVLRALLDWPESGRPSQGLLNNRESGSVGPNRFLKDQRTGWTWAVANLRRPALEVWLEAGADPNAEDKAGRPGLAYAHRPETVQALLAAGADPLNPALPHVRRRANFHALLEGWAFPLAWHEEGANVDKDWSDGLAYMRRRLAEWPPEEAWEAGAHLSFKAYWVKASEGAKSAERWIQMAKDLTGRAPPQPTDEIEWLGRRWSFVGGLARHQLQGSAGRKRVPIPRHSGRREVIPGVPEKTVVDLAQLPHIVTEAKAVLHRHGPVAVANALRLLLEDFSEEGGELPDTALQKTVERVLRHALDLGRDWEQAAFQITQGLFDSLNGEWHGSAHPNVYRNFEDYAAGLLCLDRQPEIALEKQGVWRVRALTAHGPFDESLKQVTRQKLLQNIAAGWTPDGVCVRDVQRWQLLSRRDPALAQAARAAAEARLLQDSIPAAPVPRIRSGRL